MWARNTHFFAPLQAYTRVATLTDTRAPCPFCPRHIGRHRRSGEKTGGRRSFRKRGRFLRSREKKVKGGGKKKKDCPPMSSRKRVQRPKKSHLIKERGTERKEEKTVGERRSHSRVRTAMCKKKTSRLRHSRSPGHKRNCAKQRFLSWGKREVAGIPKVALRAATDGIFSTALPGESEFLSGGRWSGGLEKQRGKEKLRWVSIKGRNKGKKKKNLADPHAPTEGGARNKVMGRAPERKVKTVCRRRGGGNAG